MRAAGRGQHDDDADSKFAIPNSKFAIRNSQFDSEFPNRSNGSQNPLSGRPTKLLFGREMKLEIGMIRLELRNYCGIGYWRASSIDLNWLQNEPNARNWCRARKFSDGKRTIAMPTLKKRDTKSHGKLAERSTVARPPCNWNDDYATTTTTTVT